MTGLAYARCPRLYNSKAKPFSTEAPRIESVCVFFFCWQWVPSYRYLLSSTNAIFPQPIKQKPNRTVKNCMKYGGEPNVGGLIWHIISVRTLKSQKIHCLKINLHRRFTDQWWTRPASDFLVFCHKRQRFV